MLLFCLLYGLISYTFSYFWGDDHLSRHDRVYGLVCPDFVASQPLQGQPRGGGCESDRQMGVFWDVFGDSGGDAGILLYPETFPSGNIIPSTFSVATSFIAVYLTFRRNPYFARAYAANDVVLIVLWILAAKENINYLYVIICFVMFLVNDLYGFVNWKQMRKRQLQTV